MSAEGPGALHRRLGLGMMALLPYRKIELHSPLPTATVVGLLADAVQPRRWLRFSSTTRPFEGTVTQSTFDICRVISYRNSFLPQIRGTITTEGSGSRISITMRLHLAVAIFMAVWLGSVLLFAIAPVRTALTGPANLGPLLVPIGMFLFGAILPIGSFAFEARKAERAIASLLDASRQTASAIQEEPPAIF